MHITDSLCQAEPCAIMTECYDWSSVHTLHVVKEREAHVHMCLWTQC